ncbi:alpha/beta hydrolase fold [Duganella sp. CF458]|uniref:esterase/lipase family protein n=1 Tax=Duganella sp. CF458 TaxID=1884368 RepID=UPI0008EA512E|nr:alpha/beta fold hydrolase [Duganella sp. CF458]SFF83594.1 alpha/beta hydrolase fold [Duganella sp. CF458]
MLLMIMALQVAVAIGIAWGLSRLVPADVALLLAVLVVLLVRLAITANNFRMTLRPVPEGAQIGLSQRVRLFFHEYASTMAVTSWHMLRHQPRMHIARVPRGVPVLLVHGYGANGGFWVHLAAQLEQRGYSHATVDLEPVFGDIEDFAVQLEQGVQALLAASRSEKVVIVAHSMGGLVARAWLRRFGASRAARIITLATPHHGTDLAHMGPGHNARQMRRDAEWLAQLDAADRGQRGLFTSIYSWHDNIIAPQDSCHLPGARNIGLPGIGHVGMGRHPEIASHILAEIMGIT